MPVPVSTDTSRGIYVPQKKKKKKEEAPPRVRQIPVYDQEARAGAIAKAYYKKTGRIPAPAKLYSFVKATESPVFKKDEDFELLFPDWISKIGIDKEDIDPVEIIPERSRIGARNRILQRHHLSPDEYRPVPQREADWRSAMVDGGAATTSYLYDENNTPILDNVRALQHDPDMKKLTNGTKDVVNPHKLEELRTTFMGKDRDELTEKQRDQLDEIAIFLANEYDSEGEGFSPHYENDLDKVTWDEFFDSYIARLAFESVAAYAIIPNAPGDPNGIKKAQAMKVIEVATNGQVKDTDDIYANLAMLAMRGDTLSTYTPAEQLQRFLYEGFLKGQKAGSTRARTAAFAEEFGTDYLPVDVQRKYKDDLSGWLESIGEPNQVYLKWAEAQAEEEKLPPTSRVLNTRFMEDTLIMMADNLQEGDEALREKWDDDKLVEFLPGGQFKFSGARYMRETIAPAILDAEESMLAPFKDIALPAMSWYERQKNKIFLMTVLEAEAQDLEGKPVGRPMLEKSKVSIGESWHMASEMVKADPDRTFMKKIFEDNGLDWKEHGTLFWFADMGWSLSVDVMFDAAWGLATSAFKNTLVNIGRKTLSPALQEKVIAAQGRRATLIAERNKLQKLGQFDTPQWETMKRQLQEVDNTIALLERPVWYDSVASGLSRSTQREATIKRTFDIRYTGMSDSRRTAVKDLIKRAGSSRDEDEITEIFSTLRNEHGIRIDPGASWMKKQHLFNRLMDGKVSADHPLMQQVFPNLMRLADEVADVDDWIDKFGALSNLGFRHGTNEQHVARRLREYIDSALDAADDTERRRIWDEFQKEVQFNARTTVVDADELRQLNRWLRKSGMDELPAGATRWQAFRSFSQQVARKHSARYTKKTRMYYAKLVENEETHVREIIEGSTVKGAKKRPRKGMLKRIIELCDDDVRNAESALLDARNAGAAGQEIADLSNTLRAAQFRQAAARDMGKARLPEPWLRDQLAKDLTMNFNVHQFAAFNSGHYGILMWMHTPGTMAFGIPFGVGPSIAQATAAFRFLAVARAGFFITVNAGDEFFRGAFTGTWGEMLRSAYWKTWWKKAKTTPQYAEVVEDTIVKLGHAGDSWGYAHPGDPANGIPRSPDFTAHLNGWLRMQNRDPISNLFLNFERHAGESDSEYVERFVKYLEDYISDPASPAGAEVRDMLERMDRLWREDFRFTDEIAAQNKILSIEEQRAWDAYAEAEALLRDNADRTRELNKTVGSFGKPGKKFKASWLRSRFGRTVDTSVSGRVSDRIALRVRTHGMSPYSADEISGFRAGISTDGSVTFAVKPDGDIIGITRVGGEKGAGEDAVRAAIESGGDHLDCFDGKLVKYYEKFGFREYRREPWNPEYAPEFWNEARHGTPDIVYMRLDRRAYDEFVARTRGYRGRHFERNFRADRRGNLAARKGRLRARVGEKRQARELTDEEALDTFGDLLNEPRIAREMEDAYRAQVAARRGVVEQYDELLALRAEKESLAASKKAAAKRKSAAIRKANKGYGRELPRDVTEMARERARELAHFDKYSGTRRVLRGGDDLNNADVDEYIATARAAGDEPPPITAIKPDPMQQNVVMRAAENAPQLSKKIWKAIPGPFWALDKSSGFLKRLVYTGKLGKEYDRLIALGFDEDEALSMAGHYAMQYTNKVMYTNSLTTFEYLTKDIILFQPAFRQFAVFWGKTWAKHPLLLSNLRSKYGTDFPEAVFGDYAGMIPMPFWMQGSFGDIILPGLGPGPLMTFRAANYLTGWSRMEDGKWQYTGDTKLDWVGDRIPLLSFMSKTSSPLLWLDDLFDGMGGYDLFPGLTPEDRVTTLQMMATGLVMPFFRDPEARRKYHMNVAQAQMSRGLKPDFDGAMDEMLDKPWWYTFFPGFKYPESGFAAATRLFSPTGKIRYVPSDIGEVKEDKNGKPIWSSVFGGETARTMADAWWEWSAAYGDEIKMQKVLDKYPKFARIRDFFKLSAQERSEFLQDPENWYLIPYITGKRTYAAGLPLIEGELWYKMQNGQVYYKDVDKYIESVLQVWETAGWDKTKGKLDDDLKTSLASAREFALEAARAQSVTPQQVKDRMEWYDNWVKGRWGNQTAGNATTVSGNVADDWLELYAAAKGKKPLEWNAVAIQERYQESLMSVAQSFWGKRPEDVSKYGIVDRYTNDALYNEGKRKDALRVANALEELLPKKWSPMFDPTTATSVDELTRLTRSSEEYNGYLAGKLAGGEWWKLGNVAKQMRSVGADLHISDRALNQNVMELDNLYAKYTLDIASVKEQSDEYKAIRAKYLNARDKILSRPGMEMLAGGPAARLAALYSRGESLDENYRRHLIASVNKSTVNWGALIQFYLDRNPIGSSYGLATHEAKLSRVAWMSVALAAQEFRTKMRHTWNETMNAYGISPDAKAASVYLRKLSDYVSMWGRVSSAFARQWKEAGGDELIINSLDNMY